MRSAINKKNVSNLINYKKNKQKIGNKTLFMIAIVYLFALNINLRQHSAVWYATAVVCIVYYLLCVVIKNKLLLMDSYCIWLLLFFVYTIFSYFWCISVDKVNVITKTLVLLALVNVLVEKLVRTKSDLEKFLFIFYLILFTIAIMIFFFVDFSQIGSERIGQGMENLNVWNANTIGEMNAVLSILSLHYLLKQKKKIINFFYLIGLCLGLFLSFNSGSRTALLHILLFIILFFGFREKGKKRITYIIVGVILLFVIYIVVMNYEPIYNVIGWRIEAIIGGRKQNTPHEASYGIRMEMILLGIEWWMKKPILGYGFGCYSTLYYSAVGIDTYSHCNFIEILVSGGIVGFIIYYSIYVNIYMLFKKNRNRNNEDQKTLFYIVLVELLLNVSTISYYNWMFHLLIMLSYISLKYCSSEHCEGTYAVEISIKNRRLY